MVSEASSTKKVCVIGAGPAGLVASRELRKEGLNVVVLEQNHDIGGQWLYDPNIEKKHPLGQERFQEVHSSMYASLRLMFSRETMGYTDFPFVVKDKRDKRRFPGHHELLLYLQDFCERFRLREMIRFNTQVVRVEMLDKHVMDDGLKWVVRSKSVQKVEKVVEEVFDAVVVATGNYSHPRLPEIKGMNSWKGRQMHSRIYRVPEPFKNEVVVVVGASVSGKEISIELVNTAKDVYISAKPTNISESLLKVISKHDNLHLCPQIVSLHEDGKVLFTDGTFTTADTIIYCTGYSYAFPFLDTKGGVTVDDNRIGPLYEHTFPPSLAPSLSFIGIPRRVIAFPFFEFQAKWIAQLLSGRRSLPSQDDMKQSIKELYDRRDAAGIPKHLTHVIIDGIKFADKIADYTGSPRLEEWRKMLCRSVRRNSEINPETFRDSYEDDLEMLQVAYNSPHFTRFGG